MKKVLTLTLILLTYFPFFGQLKNSEIENLLSTPSINYQEQQYVLNNATANSTTIVIHATEKEYTKDLKDYLKTNLNLEGKKNSGYTSVIKAIIPQWSNDSLSFHYKTEKDISGTKLIVIAEQNGQFISQESHPETWMKIKSSLTSQIKTFYIKLYDKSIAEQQKYYDSQVKDMEKLRKQLTKTQGKIEDNNKSKQKNESKLRDARSGSSKKDGDIKSLNAQLQNDKKAVDQAQKEVDAQAILITEKEGEYNRLNYSGSLATKEGEKVIKELGKLRKKQEKLRGTLSKANANKTKTENALLKAEQDKSKQESKITDLQSDIDSQDSKNTSLKSDLGNVEREINDKQRVIDEARNLLDRLKTAKNGLTTTP